MFVSIAQTKVVGLHFTDLLLLECSSNIPLNLTLLTSITGINQCDGNWLSYHLTRLMPDAVWIWEEPNLWGLSKSGSPPVTDNQIQQAIASIRNRKDGYISPKFSFLTSNSSTTSVMVLSKLAARVLQFVKFDLPIINLNNGVFVRKEIDVKAEIIEIKDELKPALRFPLTCEILCHGSVADFIRRQPKGYDLRRLIGAKVREVNSSKRDGGMGEIVAIPGPVAQHRDFMLSKTTKEENKRIIINAPNLENTLSVVYRSQRGERYYPASGMRLVVNEENAAILDVDPKKARKAFNIGLDERPKLLQQYKAVADQALNPYGLQLSKKSINTLEHESNFLIPKTSIEEIPLLIGKGQVTTKRKALSDIKKYGVFRRSETFKNEDRPIRIAGLKLCNPKSKLKSFLEKIQAELIACGFKVEIVDMTSLEIIRKNDVEARDIIRRHLNELIKYKNPDLVITFLPGAKPRADAEEENGIYYLICRILEEHQLGSQVYHEFTILNEKHEFLLRETIPAILAKLGNVPYVLARPLPVDVVISLDVSRRTKKRGGTVNACACVTYYDSRLARLRTHTYNELDLIDGEIIPNHVLEEVFSEDLRGKNVAAVRDGHFVGTEPEFIITRSKVVGFTANLLEYQKTGFTRLFGLDVVREGTKKINKVRQPMKGLALINTRFRANLVTTNVSDRIGLAQPLQLAIHPAGVNPGLSWALEVVTCLTLVYYGSQKDIRLPAPAHNADRLAYKVLHGVRPSSGSDRQPWL